MSMREPTFFILAALTGPPLHGYGVMQAVRELSGGRLVLRAGTLYAALDRLMEEGLLVVEREEVTDGRLRRYYRLTDEGTTALRLEVDSMRAKAQMAAARLKSHVGRLASSMTAAG
jgi:DNA-binding PadR family transcriptional regulator